MQLHAAIRELACQTYDLRDCQFGDRARVAEGRVEDGYTEGGGGFEIHLICADTEAADDYEVLCGFEDSLGELGL